MKNTAVKACPGHKVGLSHIDPDETGLDKERASILLQETHQKLDKLQQRFYAERTCSLLIIFQALDTGGKDGAIRNLCSGLNPAGIRITAFKVPTQEELDHDFLWRAHKATPGKGMVAVWNRSHYEDVLVARVHKLVPKKIWKARYDQINRFEQILAENGTRIVKFMLHISKDEQARRIQARIEHPEKQWKLSLADLKERTLWRDYAKAYEDAINCCTTEWAPWYVVPANHKWARNLAVARRSRSTPFRACRAVALAKAGVSWAKRFVSVWLAHLRKAVATGNVSFHEGRSRKATGVGFHAAHRIAARRSGKGMGCDRQ